MRSWPRCDFGGGYTVPAIFDSVDNVQKIQGPCPNFFEIGNSWVEKQYQSITYGWFSRYQSYSN